MTVRRDHQNEKVRDLPKRDASENTAPQEKSSMAFWMPVLLFVGLAGFFYFALKTGDPSKIPSVLVGKSVPEFVLPPVDGLTSRGQVVTGFSNLDLAQGKVSIVNVWASWCVPCHTEHPMLVRLQEVSKAPLFGINYKDRAQNARRFLVKYGNPFQAVGVDRNGRTSIDWGVYGVPETFVVDGRGRIVYKHVGPITEQSINTKFMPVIARTRKGKAGGE